MAPQGAWGRPETEDNGRREEKNENLEENDERNEQKGRK
jgi:hypothetical protein